MALEDTLFIVLYWIGPVGLGIFFAGLGYLIKCVGKVAQKDREYKDSKGWPQTDFSRVLPFFSK